MIPVLLLGSGLTVLGSLRALRSSGISSCVYGAAPGCEITSRWYVSCELGRAAETTAITLPDLLRASELESAVIMPCSDHWAIEVARMPPDLAARYFASSACTLTLRTVADKALFSRLLAEEKIPHPLTILLDSPEDVDAIPDEVLDGAFLKPHDSQTFFARYGVKAFKVQGPRETKERVASVMGSGMAVLLQQYIPGPSSLHYFVDGFVDSRGDIKALFARRRLRMFPEDFGNSSYMVSIPLDEVDQAVGALRTILPRIRYRGIFSAEFKRDPRDGVYKLLEINPRPWWYVEFAARCGVNVCRMAYDDALGLPVSQITSYRVGARLVYPYYDFFACREARRRHELTVSDWVGSWVVAQNPLFNWSDPAPALKEILSIAGRHIRRLGRAS